MLIKNTHTSKETCHTEVKPQGQRLSPQKSSLVEGAGRHLMRCPSQRFAAGTSSPPQRCLWPQDWPLSLETKFCPKWWNGHWSWTCPLRTLESLFPNLQQRYRRMCLSWSRYDCDFCHRLLIKKNLTNSQEKLNKVSYGALFHQASGSLQWVMVHCLYHTDKTSILADV